MSERVWPTRWTPWSLLVSAFGYAVAMDKDAQGYEEWCWKRDDLAREVAEMLEAHFTAREEREDGE